MCNQKLSYPSTALLLIDLQQELFRKRLPIYQAKDLLDNITLLTERAHQAGLPVVYVQHCNQGALKPGTDGWQLHPRLKPGPDDFSIHKQHGSAFRDTPLKELLDARGIHTVVVTGLVSHGCVQATCLEARKLGYRVILVTDGHSNYHRQAARVMDECHQTVSAAGVELAEASTLTFGLPLADPA
jgi:nicotinamidase-related amidase